MNVYKNEQDRITYLNKYYTVAGVRALETRLTALAENYRKDLKYPVCLKCLAL